MKKTVSYLLVLLFSGSLAWAGDSVNSLAEVSDQARFSRDRVTAELSLHENGKEDWKLEKINKKGKHGTTSCVTVILCGTDQLGGAPYLVNSNSTKH